MRLWWASCCQRAGSKINSAGKPNPLLLLLLLLQEGAAAATADAGAARYV
jgi:hypothetical protein